MNSAGISAFLIGENFLCVHTQDSVFAEGYGTQTSEMYTVCPGYELPSLPPVCMLPVPQRKIVYCFSLERMVLSPLINSPTVCGESAVDEVEE